MTDQTALPMLIARDAELAHLQQHLLQVGERGPRLVLLTGAAGVGTTRVAERFAAEHEAQGGTVRRAVAAPWEHELPYGVLSQLLGRSVAADSPVAAARLVAAEVAPQPSPVLLLVDDAAWSDSPTLQALWTAVRHHRDSPFLVLLVGAVDDAGTPHDSSAVLSRVTDRVPVAALPGAGVQALAAAHGVTLHPTLVERLTTFTQGRPGAVRALLEELPGDFWSDYDPTFPAPRGLQREVARRFAGLAPDARDLTAALAVLGRSRLAVAAALSGVDAPLDALDRARAAGLATPVERDGTTYVAITDPMTTAAVLEEIGHQRRAELNSAAVDLVDDPVARLRHRVAATPMPDPALADELEALAEDRAALGEWRVVAELLTRAARLTSEPARREDRLVRAFDALVGAGDNQGAVAAVAEVESLRETPLRNAVLGYLAVVRGRPGDAENRLTRAWDIVNPERDPGAAATVCQRWVLHCLARCRGEDLITWADRAIELAPAGSPAVVEAQAIRGLGVAFTGHRDQALADYLELAEDVGHGAQAQRVAMARGWLQLVLGHVEEARSALLSALPTDYLGGSARISLWAHAWLARSQFMAGDWDEALATADRGLDLAQRSGMRLIEPLLWWTVAQTSALRGDWERAEEALRRGDAGPRDYEIMRVASCLARAAVAEARADYAAVLRALEPLRQPWAGTTFDEPGAWPWPDVYANALVIQGRYDEAATFLDHHERVAQDRDHQPALARLAYARGRLLGATGDVAGASATFDSAAGRLADLPLPYDRARVHFAWGQTLRRAGKRREADDVLQTARELYAGLGATTYVERCDRELRAGGVHATRAAQGARAVDALTPQEELVSDLVARGMTNREVATDLFVSTKTVQYHLTRIYAKLGIRSRGELAAMRRDPVEESQQT